MHGLHKNTFSCPLLLPGDTCSSCRSRRWHTPLYVPKNERVFVMNTLYKLLAIAPCMCACICSSPCCHGCCMSHSTYPHTKPRPLIPTLISHRMLESINEFFKPFVAEHSVAVAVRNALVTSFFSFQIWAPRASEFRDSCQTALN